MDFTIADMFGEDSIRDTYDRAIKGWAENVEYMTELVLVLNWKSWYWYTAREKYAEKYTSLYTELYEQADQYCLNHLSDNELDYFLRTVD